MLVKVLVDAAGNVSEAQILSSKEIGYGFDEAAVRAARKARYQPGTENGRPTSMWTTLVVRFN